MATFTFTLKLSDNVYISLALGTNAQAARSPFPPSSSPPSSPDEQFQNYHLAKDLASPGLWKWPAHFEVVWCFNYGFKTIMLALLSPFAFALCYWFALQINPRKICLCRNVYFLSSGLLSESLNFLNQRAGQNMISQSHPFSMWCDSKQTIHLSRKSQVGCRKAT